MSPTRARRRGHLYVVMGGPFATGSDRQRLARVPYVCTDVQSKPLGGPAVGPREVQVRALAFTFSSTSLTFLLLWSRWLLLHICTDVQSEPLGGPAVGPREVQVRFLKVIAF